MRFHRLPFFFSLFALATAALAQKDVLPVLESGRPVVSIRDGMGLQEDSWTLAPELSPDVYQARLIDGEATDVTFLSDLGSLTFRVELGSTHDFIIRHQGRDCLTRIVGSTFVPAARFDDAYQARHRGRIVVEVPEVYELVNIAIALTDFGRDRPGFVYQGSAYYESMWRHFEPFRDQPLVVAFDELLQENPGRYSRLKMNGYSFVFDESGEITQSPIYDRTGFGGDAENTLRPHLTAMRRFARETDFRAFYAKNRPFYRSQIDFFTSALDLEGMRRWLDANFPGGAEYDGYKVIFSPLVAFNQSSTWFESNGYRELQPHVNFPWAEAESRYLQGELSKEGQALFQGNIVFTEINHGYINPEAEKYADRIRAAVEDRSLWVAADQDPGYYPGLATFNEYMNWGLVSLRLLDLAPPQDHEVMLRSVSDQMSQRRGFPRFAAFHSFLVDLYRSRPDGETLADLYPEIVAWFEAQAASARAGEIDH